MAIETIDFPNSFDDYLETYFEIVAYITDDVFSAQIGVIADTEANKGIGGLYDLAKQWTDEFEQTHKGREWDGDFFDTLDEFLKNKNLGL